MKKYLYLGVSLMLILSLSLKITLSAVPENNQITDLEINDLPNDEGNGLTLTWTPLPVEKKIIEYRIYRGVCRDTLFHIATIEIDPLVGVTSPKLFHTDAGFNEFIDFNSPAKLKKEVQQSPESPLYRKMPRDPEVFSKFLSEYTILAMIPKKNYYYRSTPFDVSKPDENGEINREILGGLPFRHFEGFLSSLIPNKTYYYTVLAVDEQRRYFPYAPIVEGVPIPNEPEAPISFYSTYVTDLKKLQFEWTDPSASSQVIQRNIHLIPEAKVSAMEQYISACRNHLNNENIKVPADPSYIIFTTDAAFPNIQTIDITDGKLKIVDNDSPYNIDPNNLEKYQFVYSFDDYLGNKVFSEIMPLRFAQSDQLFSIPAYQIGDKPDDKGDYNQLLFGRPLVFMTQTSFLNEKRTKLLLNYDFAENELHQIKGITFKFFDSHDNLIKEINDFLPEKILKLRIANEFIAKEGIKVEITPQLKSKTPIKPYTLTQTIYYNAEFGLFENSDLKLEGETIADFSYYIYRRSKLDTNFDLARFLSPFNRSYDDNIPFETTIYKVVNRFDQATKNILFDATITIDYDREKDLFITTNMFADQIAKDIEYYSSQISKLEAQLQTANEEELPSLQAELEHYKNKLWMETEHPELSVINKITNQKERIKALIELNDKNSRSYEYIFAKTDTKGLFHIDPIYEKDGETYLFPVGNWFKRDQLPALIASLLFGLIVFIVIRRALSGKDMYIRPIAGLQEIDNAVGRATEMGRPILYVPGFGYIEETATLASLSILSNVARKTAEYDTRVLVPVSDYIVLPVAMETVREAHIAAGRPDTYNRDDIFYIAGDQFAFVAAVNGVMIRQKTAANFYLGVFFAEALIMTEVGNAQGAIQIAGSDSTTQIPFFITTCDYTLIGEELYGASAYLSRDPMILGTLKAQDYAKLIMILFIIAGSVLSTFKITFLIRALPSQ